MKSGLEHALNRPLTENEEKHIAWLMGWDKETRQTFEKLFQDVYRAGQVDACQTFKR